MAISEAFEFDRLRVKFPRTYKALVSLYPGAWDQMLAVIEAAMEAGKTASVVVGKLSILRGLDRDPRRWVMLSLQADRREIMLRRQRSFLTELHDKSLDDILAELKAFEYRVPVRRLRHRPQGSRAATLSSLITPRRVAN